MLEIIIKNYFLLKIFSSSSFAVLKGNGFMVILFLKDLSQDANKNECVYDVLLLESSWLDCGVWRGNSKAEVLLFNEFNMDNPYVCVFMLLIALMC